MGNKAENIVTGGNVLRLLIKKNIMGQKSALPKASFKAVWQEDEAVQTMTQLYQKPYTRFKWNV